MLLLRLAHGLKILRQFFSEKQLLASAQQALIARSLECFTQCVRQARGEKGKK